MEIIDHKKLKEMEEFVRASTVRGLPRNAYKAGTAIAYLSELGWKAAFLGNNTLLHEVTKRIKVISESEAGRNLLERYG